MQKYKIVASKSQKKYTLIISADSETQAKEKLHKEDYSILSIEKVNSSEIEWKKFIFQVELEGQVKNWIIVWKDIFKVYVKLRDELWYNILSLYPQGDEAGDSAEKKQQIMDQLVTGYELQKKIIKEKKTKKEKEESFYMQKELNETYILIEKAVEKFDVIFNNKEKYNIEDETFYKLEKIYEKLVHVKGSTNLSKLKEVGELALVKIAKIELENVEEHKNQESRELLKETNALLKKIGSNEHFIEEDRDIKKKILMMFSWIKNMVLSQSEENKKDRKSKKELIDKKSYNFLKTVLLLEKYNDKLSLNTKEIFSNITLFINPFSKSELKEKITLKRKVIKQNISILKAKKSWSVGSYTGVKRKYDKITDVIFEGKKFLWGIIIFLTFLYTILFFGFISLIDFKQEIVYINAYPIMYILLGILIIFFLQSSKNIILLSLNIVFFSFIFIFSLINF